MNIAYLITHTHAHVKKYLLSKHNNYKSWSLPHVNIFIGNLFRIVSISIKEKKPKKNNLFGYVHHFVLFMLSDHKISSFSAYLLFFPSIFHLWFSYSVFFFSLLILCFCVAIQRRGKQPKKNVINRSENSVSIAHSHSHSQFKYWVINIFSKIVFV